MTRPALRLGAVALLVLLTACSTTNGPKREPEPDRPYSLNPAPQLRTAALAALRRGDAAAARDAAQQMVLTDPRSAHAHLLLAASHHLTGDPGSLDMALSGYGAAERFAGQNAWVSLLAGMAATERSQHRLALEHFAKAALADPEEPLAFEGLASAAYASGRLEMAEAAAATARRLHAGSVPAWRVLTLAAAGKGDAGAARTLLAQAPRDVSDPDRQWVARRTQTLLRTAALDRLQLAQAEEEGQEPEADEAQAPPLLNGDRRQLTVDVTMILADGRKTRAYGVNLLDGLTASYSAERNTSITSTDGGPYTGTTTITRAIGIPALNYNLNIFNRGGRYYEMVARPSLTAFEGQESTFFVGEQINVALSGVNAAQLERIDVGVTLKITPSEIRDDGAVFRIEADRSFFSDQGLGSFAQGLSTFKQSVTATADVRFGETLILSGLSESVTDGTDSRVPGLGDIPGPDLLFSRQTRIQRDRSVLVLVTPSEPAGFARGRRSQPALERLIALWDQVIEPRTGLEALVRRLERSPRFTRAAAGDVYVRPLSDPAVMGGLLAALSH